MFKKLFFCSTLPLALVCSSCSSLYKVDKQTYVIEVNNQNETFNNLSKVSGVYEPRKTLHDTLTGNYLLRYKYKNETKYDYLNNYFYRNGVSAKFLKFGIIDEIHLVDEQNSTHIFNTDEDSQINNVTDFIHPDINRGYKNPIYQIQTNNQNSINSSFFSQKLASSKLIRFKVKNNIYWYDKDKKTDTLINAKDIEKSIEKANLSSQQTNELKAFGIEKMDFTTNENNSYFEIKLNNNFKAELFLDLIINNKIFSAYSDKFNYSEYYLVKNDLKHTLYKSLNNANDIQSVLIKYNVVGKVDKPTHAKHLLNEYQQGLLSSNLLDDFSDVQQKQLIRDFNSNKGIKLSIVQNFSNNIVNTIMFKDFIDKPDMNNIFEIMMYGKNKDKNSQISQFYSQNNVDFRNNITQIINKYTLNFIANKTNYYDNFISPNAIISNAQNTNYLKVIDANDHVSKGQINLAKNIEFYPQDLKKNYYNAESFLNVDKQLKSLHFESISKNITKIIDNFYKENPNIKDKKINFILPLKLESLDTRIIEKLNKIFNEINQNLQVNIVDIHSKIAKKYYNFSNYTANNTIEYINKLLLTSNNNLINALTNSDVSKYKILNKTKDLLMKFIDQNKITLNLNDKQFLEKMSEFSIKLHNKFSYFEIIKLINEIKLLYSLPYNLSSNIDLDSFKYELIQPWIIKPTREDNLIYFEDIKMEGKNE